MASEEADILKRVVAEGVSRGVITVNEARKLQNFVDQLALTALALSTVSPKGGYQPIGNVTDPQNPPKGKVGRVMVDPETLGQPVIKDSGERREFETGAVRDIGEGKGRFDLVPPEAVRAYAVHMERGAIKYGERNWEKGISMHSFLDSGIRHLMDYLEGKKDEPHLDAGFWNIGCAIATRERIKTGKLPETLDDLPYGR